MSKQQTTAPTLDQRIGTALSGNGELAVGDLRVLLDDIEAAITETDAKVETNVSLDVLTAASAAITATRGRTVISAGLNQ